MYNILVIDDQQYKLEDIRNQMNKEFVNVDTAMNLFSAKSKINCNKYDLILLDVAINNSVSRNEFVGLDVLSHLQCKKIGTPVIVVTQFFDFNDFSISRENAGFFLTNDYYKKNIDYNLSTNIDVHLLPNLHKYMSQNYKYYYGCILYLQNDTIWINSLKEMLYKLGGKKYESFIVG